MLVIGLTGGIGSGKSLASEYFRELGACVIDADELSRDLVRPGTAAAEKIRQQFGEAFFNDSGELNRQAMREAVFSSADARQQLEKILHPAIRSAMKEKLAGCRGPYAVLVMPLLIETGQQDMVDRILLIDASESLQKQRVRLRDQLSNTEIDQIMSAQTDRKTRLQAADDIISNDKGRTDLLSAVEKLHRQYLQLATSG